MSVLSADTDLIASGVLDSLALVELLLQIETQYGLRVSLEKLDFEDFRSVAGIARFVARERGST
ncbi:D-alanine--poly(phosphoribitol) ligase subunit 2 [compost metagenome]